MYMKIKLQNFVDNASTIQNQNITKCSLNLFIRNWNILASWNWKFFQMKHTLKVKTDGIFRNRMPFCSNFIQNDIIRQIIETEMP